MELGDYLANDGLGYSTLWSIGCPFHCTFCGNTKFIANDPLYKKIRHPSARYMVDEIKSVRKRFPHVSQVSFHDDSFMAITYQELEKFAELWKEELGDPLRRLRGDPQLRQAGQVRDPHLGRDEPGAHGHPERQPGRSSTSTSARRRPTASWRRARSSPPSPRNTTSPPAYDIIMDNPIETRQDVVDTLELLYKMPRPYTLFIYSLKVIPNTEMEQAMKDRGVDLDEISANYAVIPARAANLILYVLAAVPPAPLAVRPGPAPGGGHAPRPRRSTRSWAWSCARRTRPSGCSTTCGSWTSRSSPAGRATSPGGSGW